MKYLRLLPDLLFIILCIQLHEIYPREDDFYHVCLLLLVLFVFCVFVLGFLLLFFCCLLLFFLLFWCVFLGLKHTRYCKQFQPF